MDSILATQLSGVLFLAGIFVFGRYLRISPSGHPRRGLSAAAGASVAYVFVRALPEMSEAQDTFTRVPLIATYRFSNFTFTPQA
jgi:hypothetical protein